MAKVARFFSIGQVAKRTGIAVSALRFYEDRGLVTPLRSPSGQRRFKASDIRRISFILAAQNLGFTLTRIADLLKTLPEGNVIVDHIHPVHELPASKYWIPMAVAGDMIDKSFMQWVLLGILNIMCVLTIDTHLREIVTQKVIRLLMSAIL